MSRLSLRLVAAIAFILLCVSVSYFTARASDSSELKIHRVNLQQQISTAAAADVLGDIVAQIKKNPSKAKVLKNEYKAANTVYHGGNIVAAPDSI